MRLHRFFSPEKIAYKFERTSQNDTSDLVTHISSTAQWRKVFRFVSGDRVVLFDGSGNDFICEIKEYQGRNGSSDETAVLKIIEMCKNGVKPVNNVSLYAAVVKKDTFEWIVEKATELGVSDIVPVIAERSEKKNLNEERLRKIAVEASEQSGRGTVADILPVTTLTEALSSIVERKQPAIIFDPSGKKFSDADFNFKGNSLSSSSLSFPESIAAFIGPEGGWSQTELDEFKKLDLPVLSLGPQILRAETAVVAALSRLVF